MVRRIVRRSRTYGMGSNPRGGAYIEIDGRRTYERRTAYRGNQPVDGGENPDFFDLAAKIFAHAGCDIWRASEEQILKALGDPPIPDPAGYARQIAADAECAAKWAAWDAAKPERDRQGRAALLRSEALT
jgi:hypothetical protein